VKRTKTERVMKTRKLNIEEPVAAQSSGGCCGPAPKVTVSAPTSSCCGPTPTVQEPVQASSGGCCG